ncbi:hypothetical protein LCGC14_2831590 [marine sediment metagenome]|uniref:Uncharacterized protein n=1 Tax=marine sediment metagenome TaxID=412755 RepID=A0A0F8YDW7_9ZZZZ
MIGFQRSELCWRMQQDRIPPEHWKWIKIRGHRRSGFSTTALKLLQEYTSSLIVYPNHDILAHARRQAIDERLVPSLKDDFHNNIAINNHLKTESELNERWFIGRRPEHRHQLIILDQASMIECGRQGELGMCNFRYELFMFCDVLVELN